MPERFVPISKRDQPAASQAVLHEGVPDHLVSSVKEFIDTACHYRDVFGLQVNVERLRQVERAIELRLNWQADFRALASLVDQALDPVRGIDILDFLVSVEGAKPNTIFLAGALTEGGSAWRVKADWSGLERRVDVTVTDAAESAMQHGKAGQHLRAAWNATYGVEPDPSTAYSQAVKAVEVAAHPVVSPNDNLATLGKIIAEMKANSGKYSFALAGQGDWTKKGDIEAVVIARLMAQLLWTGQHDRHGNFEPSKPISVSQGEAEAAVHLAVVLVQWFETGVIGVISPT